MPLALSLDLGTTSIGAIAINTDGAVVRQVRLPNDSALSGLPSGCAEQSPARLRTLAIDALRQLAAQLTERPHCLGLTGQMHGMLLVDVARRPLTNLITWQDRRANLAAPNSTATYLEQLLGSCAESDLSQTGCRPAAGYLGTTLFVLQQQKFNFVNAHRAAFLADWIAAELTGIEIVTDPSNAAASGVYDLQNGCWNDELIKITGAPRSLFPAVCESGTVIGTLTSDVAVATGLPVGLPVCNAIGDNQAAVLGSVRAGEPAIQINVGTGGQINWPIETFTRVPGMDTRYLPLGRLMLVGAGLSGGDAYAWVNRTTANWLAEFGIEKSRDEIYTRMNELAAQVSEDNAGLACEPLFRGTRRNPSARGEFRGISFDNFTLGHVARAVLQGIADGMYSFYEQAGDVRPEKLTRIIGSGNGLRQNPLLVRAVSQTFNRPVLFPVHEEEAAYGTALLAGATTGMWPSLEAAGQRIRLDSM